MSPLWSDQALAEAGWADAVERGLVDSSASAKWDKRPSAFARVGRIPRPRPTHSFAL